MDRRNRVRARIGGLVVAAALAACVAAGSALALVGGSQDGNQHPYVGLLVYFPTGNSAGGAELCSGSLLSPTVFVTAAHCAPSGAVVFVDVQEQALADLQAGGGVPGLVTDAPGFALVGGGLAGSDRNDVAVVRLLAPIAVGRYASLPAVGSDDSLPNNQVITNVGYGVTDAKALSGFGSRMSAPAKIIPGGGATGADFLKISSSPGHGGATCFGDSGGPNLLGDTILAVNSYGASATCNAVSYSQRLDTPGINAFVSSFLH